MRFTQCQLPENQFTLGRTNVCSNTLQAQHVHHPFLRHPIDPKGFNSMKQPAPRLSERSDGFPIRSKRVETLASTSGCLASLVADTELAVGDTTKDARYLLTQGVNSNRV